ncbi:MAG: VOC family protein [Holophagales bacterium]|nr:VOC family protein [Holophagales bacterium]
MHEDRDSSRQSVFPFLRYANAADAIVWLEKAFGFQPEMVVPGDDGSIAHAQLRFGASVVMLGSVKDRDPLGLSARGALAGSSQGIYLVVDDAEAAYAQAVDAGAEVVMELTRTDYGSEDFSVRDPEGHLWSFGTYHPDDDASAG